MVFTLLIWGRGGAWAEGLPSAAEIVPKVLARDEAETASLKHYQYHQTVLTEKLDGNGAVKGSSRLEMEVKPGEDNDFTVTADGKGGNGLTPSQTTDRQRKEARDSEKLKASFSLRHLAGCFEIRVAGEEMLRGQPAYVLAFTPRKGQPYRNRIEKILNHLQGNMWVSRADYRILQTKANLAEPVSMAWVFATMKELHFFYRTETIPGGSAISQSSGPAEFNLDYRIGVMGREIRQRQSIAMDDYQLR